MDQLVAAIEHACGVFAVRAVSCSAGMVTYISQPTFASHIRSLVSALAAAAHTRATRLEHCKLCQNSSLCVQNPSNHAAHQEAAATLLAFRNSQAPIGVCQHILEHSGSEQAKFQVS